MSSSKLKNFPVIIALLTCFFVVLPIQVSPQEEIVEVTITAVNLHDEPIFNATVQVWNATESPRTFIKGAETDENGQVFFTLANNTYYEFDAFWEMAYMGNIPKRLITSDIIIDNFNFSLARLKLTATTEANIPLPSTELNITFSYPAAVTNYITIGDEIFFYYTLGNETTSGNASFTTDPMGSSLVLSNMIVNANYTIEVMRYGLFFDKTLIPNLNSRLEEGWANVTFVAPTYALTVNVRDSTNSPIQSAQVNVHEFNRQLPAESGITDKLGNAEYSVTLGKYQIQTYYQDTEFKRSILINDTIIEISNDKSYTIQSETFPIEPFIRILDYLGQPINNMIIEIERRFGEEWVKNESTQKTDSNGLAPLSSFAGEYRISAYDSGRLYESKTIFIDKTEQVIFKLDKCILLGGYLFTTSQIATLILMSLLFLSLIIFFLHKKLFQKTAEKK